MTAMSQANIFSNYDVSGHKIMSLSEEKRRQIIGAAMKEFTKGYRKANTAVIAREADISKGLLFHYFPTKKELFFFLVKYSLGKVLAQYESIDVAGKDFLESMWELTMVKMELIKKHGELYDFMLSALFSMQKEFPEEFQSFTDPTIALIGRIYEKTDNSLIREDIDPDKAYKLIAWMIKGYGEHIVAEMTEKRAASVADMEPDMERLLDEWKEYLGILRKAFYKNGARYSRRGFPRR